MKKFLLILACAFHGMSAITLSAYGLTSSDNSPVTFLENKGQWPGDILYQGTSTAINIYFLQNGLSFAQTGEEEEDSTGHDIYPYLVWNMKFANTASDIIISGETGHESKISYLKGNDPANWVIHPTEYSLLNYTNIYDHIDLVYYGDGNNLKYDYIIHPGGNINSIMGFFEGVQYLSVNNNGEIEITTPWDVQLQKAPVAWQQINGMKQPVNVQYVLINDTTFGFIGDSTYNNNFDLVIDPLFEMVWSSYTKAIGASNNLNYCFSNAMDKEGNVYMTGMVDATFPTTPGAYSGAGTVYPDIFVAKFSSDGTTMLYSTYLPGNSSEHGIGIAVDDSGRAYVTGVVDLNFTGITNFPSTPNAYQPVHNTGSDAFLTVLNPNGTGLVYSSFLGGTGSETGYDVALGPPGIAYITGNTSSTNFPIVASSSFSTGSNDMFVSKFDINQSGTNSLVYSTKIGGGSFNNVAGRSIAVNSAGNAFVTGTVYNGFGTLNFPVIAGAYASVYNSGQDNIMSFVTKLSANTPVTLDYSTLLAPGIANAIEVDDLTGDAFIVGTTYTFAFPVTTGALQTTHAGAGGTDAFLIRLNSTGSALIYSTFLGGDSYDQGTGLAINSIGEAYVAGITQDFFPTSPGSLQPNNAGTYDFFVVHVNASGTAYGCGGSTYVGGSDADYSGSFYDYAAPQVSIRDHGGINDTISISATSHSQDFPTTPGSYCPAKLNSIADQPVFFKLTCVVSTPLPIELISFTGTAEGNRNLLKWKTASEINNDYFSVEQSKDEKQFETIGIVKGAGNSTHFNSYSFSDYSPLNGINYYRLKQVDYNNAFTYSQTISVRNKQANDDAHCLVYAGETAGNFILSCKQSDISHVQILDVNGRIVKVIEFTGNSSNQIDLNGFRSGWYIIKIIDGENVKVLKLFKS